METPPCPISPDGWRDGGRFFDWRGEPIFCRVAGDGPPLLLIHGFPTSSWDWARLWPRLAERHRVLALDMLGFGLSGKPRRFAYSILAQADLCEAFLQREGVTRCRVLAHDYGDTVAQELLARQRDGRAPAQIEAACLLNGGLFPEAHRPLLLQRLLASRAGPLLARLSTFQAFAATFRRICARPIPEEELRGMWRLLNERDGRAVLPGLLGYMAERRRHRERWAGALQHATVPLRLIDGMEDPISGAHLVARYRELVPGADVVELAGVGHYPQIEDSEAVLAAAIEFFSRRPGALSGGG